MYLAELIPFKRTQSRICNLELLSNMYLTVVQRFWCHFNCSLFLSKDCKEYPLFVKISRDNWLPQCYSIQHSKKKKKLIHLKKWKIIVLKNNVKFQISEPKKKKSKLDYKFCCRLLLSWVESTDWICLLPFAVKWNCKGAFYDDFTWSIFFSLKAVNFGLSEG